jgi:hypothetical protein
MNETMLQMVATTMLNLRNIITTYDVDVFLAQVINADMKLITTSSEDRDKGQERTGREETCRQGR